MKPTIVIAIVLIVAGVLGLAYGGLTYTNDTSNTQIGPLDIAISDRETIALPIWAGIVSIVIGGGILLFPLIGRATETPKVITRKI